MSNPPQRARRISVTATQGGELEEFSPLRSTVGEIGDRLYGKGAVQAGRGEAGIGVEEDLDAEELVGAREEVADLDRPGSRHVADVGDRLDVPDVDADSEACSR